MKFVFIFIFLTNITLFSNDNSEIFDNFEDEFKVEKKDDFDPLSGYNAVMTDINHIVYTKALFPLSRCYASVVDEDIRVALSNFFYNILFAKRFTNNLLQLKLQNSVNEDVRFVVNSTIGILGFYDPASQWLKLEKHDEDFGQTLGFYGIGGGFHIVLPLAGPSNLRDALSLSIDRYFDPVNFLESDQFIVSKTIYYLNDGSFKSDQYEILTKDALELYPLLKESYEQYRESEIKK
ncbi:MAG: VacJ family lipoprotein [Campylobacterales bacterium]|nr:VacJ family lipoprotein [Campylobacterales bacterium]